MVFASLDDYQASSLRNRMQVLKRLAEALGLASVRSGMADEFVVADRLALELGFSEDDESESLYRFLVRVAAPLEALLESGKLTPTDSARAVAEQAAAGTEVARAMYLATELGWTRFDQSRPAQRILDIDDIEEALVDLLVCHLERRVFDMLSRWQRTGVWANRPSVVRDLRRPFLDPSRAPGPAERA